MGLLINMANDEIVSQQELKIWAAENPMPVLMAGKPKPSLIKMRKYNGRFNCNFIKTRKFRVFKRE